MRPHRLLLLSLLLSSTVAACAAPRSHAEGAEPAGARPAKLRRHPNRITAAEIDPARFSNAYSAVQTLRPHWLRVRGPSSINLSGGIRVYHDNVPAGGIAYLNQIPTSAIRSLEFVSGVDASQRWGIDHGDGAILVFTSVVR